MYVYKLNEDIILYKHSSENNQSGGHMVLAQSQHTPGHRNDCTKGRLENHVDSYYHPSLLSLLIKKARIISPPFFPFSFLEIGWLYQNGILLDPVLQMIII